jgi:predicted membrane protein
MIKFDKMRFKRSLRRLTFWGMCVYIWGIVVDMGGGLGAQPLTS